MDYLIFSDGEPIGRVWLVRADEGMGLILGAFEPLPAYERVRAIFRQLTIAQRRHEGRDNDGELAPYHRARDALKLVVTTEEGRYVPTIWIQIEDYLGEEEGIFEFEVAFAVRTSVLFQPTGSFFEDPRYWEAPTAYRV